MASDASIQLVFGDIKTVIQQPTALLFSHACNYRIVIICNCTPDLLRKMVFGGKIPRKDAWNKHCAKL